MRAPILLAASAGSTAFLESGTGRGLVSLKRTSRWCTPRGIACLDAPRSGGPSVAARRSCGSGGRIDHHQRQRSVIMLWRSSALLALVLCAAAAGPGRVVEGAQIRGKVSTAVDAFHSLPIKRGSAIELLLLTGAGDQLRTFADPDGWFLFEEVPTGSHVLTTIAPQLVFPEFRLDVSAQAGLTRAALLYNGAQVMSQPFVVRPVAVAHYFEARKPLDVWGLIKSPYGIMICFMVFAIVVFPALKVDPEEYKEAMASLRGGDASTQQQQQQQRLQAPRRQ